MRATASQGTCSGGVTCLLGDLAVNATATITIVATVDSATPAGSLLNTRACRQRQPGQQPGQQRRQRRHDRDGGRQAGHPEGRPGHCDARRRAGLPDRGQQHRAVAMRRTSWSATRCRARSRTCLPPPASGSCSIAGNLLTCTVAWLPVGGQAFIAIQGTVARSASGTLVNTAARRPARPTRPASAARPARPS